ncbi:SHOCT domain-containing protein [Deinococcus aluminii]|uniref:SHOCT domain-containing protein n=1 Tax=Deinococcus aluminii TaxID=1656885 RepID=A0ABP9XHY3_9DEIO
MFVDVIINNAAPGTPVQVIPQPYGGPYPPGSYGYGPGYGPGLHGGFPLFPLLLIIGAVLFLRRWGWRHRPQFTDGGRLGEEVRDTFRRGRARFLEGHALEIARERYAKGEINADEYETLRRTLMDEGPHATQGRDEPRQDL